MLITLTGNNHYLLKQRLDELKKTFLADNDPLSLREIDAESAELQIILEAVGSTSLFAQASMVVMRDLSLNKAASEHIEQIISSTADTTTLILLEPKVDKRSAYFKVLKRLSQLEEYPETDSAQLTTWLITEAKKQGAKLSFSDAKTLVERAGCDQSLLANELAKLITYNSEISSRNIELLVAKTPQSKIFDLLDAAFGTNKKRALELYSQQRAQKIEPQEILAMIAWQLKLVSLAKLAGNMSASQIATDAGVSVYPINKAQNLANSIALDKLKKMVSEAYRIDKLIKTKPIEPDAALKTYIVSL